VSGQARGAVPNVVFRIEMRPVGLAGLLLGPRAMRSFWGAGWVVLLVACSGVDDGHAPPVPEEAPVDAATPSHAGSAPKLPDPAVRRVAVRDLSPAELLRSREIDELIARRYQGYRIVDTVETYAGDVIDYVDSASIPGSDAEPPPRPSAAEMVMPAGVELQQTEVERHPELRGPAGTTAMVRPRFDTYLSGESKASSLAEHLRSSSVRPRAMQGTAEVAPEKNAETGQPAGVSRLYGGYVAKVANKRVIAWVNEFTGAIEAGTFSLIEVATMCPGANLPKTAELVGATISRDRSNFADSKPRIQLEFLTAGVNAVGDNIGGWDGMFDGFVPAAGRPYGPGAVVTASTINGQQFESRIEIQLSGGNWWISHNGNWLGYYPGGLFELINTKGCQAHWYGEVFDPTPGNWTNTNMGSGQYASQGYGKAAYVRDPYYHDANNVSHWLDANFAFGAGIQDPDCYTSTLVANGAAPWERSFFMGGPGGEAVGCD
jgi:hypothetical protein